MDQNFPPWSPIAARPVLRWPEGARVALAVIVNLEHWDWEVPAGTPAEASPMGGPEGLWSGNQPQFPDIGGYGNHEYRIRVGIFRFLAAVLDKYGITPTLALAKYPNVAVKATGQAGYAEDAYPFRSFHKHLHRCFDAFGPERVFWGTDITRMPCSWRQCVTVFTEELPWLKGPRPQARHWRRAVQLDGLEPSRLSAGGRGDAG